MSKSILGAVLDPTSADYDEVRRVHNGLIDKRPALIVRCRGVADIADAVLYAVASKLEISVRGGGHNPAGRAVTEGGLMIDLSLMKGIHVDPAARTAVVEGGVLWKELNRETQLRGLAVTGGVVGTTGVAGLTLGGGIGWLMCKHGLALDNLLAVTLVLADGSVVRACETVEPDLFWAVRGGGGNFGVAASFEFKLHPLGPMVVGGLAAFPFAEAGKVLRSWRNLTAEAGDDLMLIAVLGYAPDGSGNKIVAVGACHIGDPKAAAEVMSRIKGFGTLAMDALGPIPYSALNTMLDGTNPRGALNYWKSGFLPALSDMAIDASIGVFARSLSPMNIIAFEHFHGAACRVPVEATAYALREPGFNVVIPGQTMNPGEADANMAWVREAAAGLQPFFGSKVYMNYLGAEDADDAAAVSAYGPNLARLKGVKRRFDPQNAFHLNVNVRPA